MEWLVPAVIATLAGTVVLFATFLFLYRQDREPFFKAWAISWFFYLLRFCFTLAILKMGPLGILQFGNLLSILSSGIFLLWGTFLFFQISESKKRTAAWVLSGLFLALSVWIVVALQLEVSYFWLVLPTYFVLGCIEIYTGIIFLRQDSIRGYGKRIVGFSFIVWGLHKMDYPFLRPVVWFAPWGYLLGAVLEFVIALSILLIYFQKNREALRKSEARFRNLVEKINEVFWVVSPDWKQILYISPSFESVWGISCDALYAQPKAWFECILEEDQQQIVAKLQEKQKEPGTPAFFPEYRIQRPDHSIRWIAARAFPVFDDQGHVIQYAGIAEDITDYKLAEERFALATRGGKVGIWDIRLPEDTFYTYGIKTLFGYTEEELASDARHAWWEKVVPAEDQEVVNQTIRDLVAGKIDHYELEHRVYMKDGSVGWILAHGMPIRDESGAVVRVVGTSTLITDIKKAEEEKKKSEKRYRALVENTPDIIMRFDADMRYLFVNSAVEKITGISASAFIGKTHRELGFPAEDCDYLERKLRQVMEQRKAVEEEFTYNGAQSQYVLNWRMFPELDGDGAVASILSIARDITEHRKMEQSYRMLFEQMLDGFAVHEIICDENDRPVDYRFVAVNPAFEKLTGLRSSDLIGRRVLDVLPNTEPQWIETYGKVALTGTPVRFENYTKALDKYYEVISFSPKPRQFATIFADITEKRKMEESLSQSRKLESIGILAGGIAHDFNNLLTAILGNVSLSKVGLEPEMALYDALDSAEKACLRAKDLTHQLLTFSKGGEPITEAASLSDIITETARFVLRGSNVKCQFHLPDDLWLVEVDKGQFSQVIHNLVLNADQAMPDGGQITILASNVDLRDMPKPYLALSEQRYVQLRIQDQGIGIPEEYRSRIFDPYFTTKQKGSGLGLASCYSIITKHKGTIAVEPGFREGTEFVIYVPASEKQSVEKSEASTPKAAVASARILVMDDEELILMMIEKLLGTLGYEVTTVTDGTDALRVYEQQMASSRFDLVIMDLTIPGGMGGRDAVTKMLAIDPSAKVVVSSGYSNDPIMANFADYGFSGVISKPYQMRELSETIQTVLGG